jgi:hypothetical protein
MPKPKITAGRKKTLADTVGSPGTYKGETRMEKFSLTALARQQLDLAEPGQLGQLDTPPVHPRRRAPAQEQRRTPGVGWSVPDFIDTDLGCQVG